jgi:hypothetical protein
MAGRDVVPTRALLMGSVGLRAGDWRISGMVGHTLCHIVDRALVSNLPYNLFLAVIESEAKQFLHYHVQHSEIASSPHSS